MSRRDSPISLSPERRGLFRQSTENRTSKKKWTSAFRVVQSLNRFKNGSRPVSSFF